MQLAPLPVTGCGAGTQLAAVAPCTHPAVDKDWHTCQHPQPGTQGRGEERWGK